MACFGTRRYTCQSGGPADGALYSARRVTRAGRRATSDELGLTRREIEVARLVTAGKSNREIAAELFLSEKTVETHLSNVFTKLGVTSRAAVAAVLARHQQD